MLLHIMPKKTYYTVYEAARKLKLTRSGIHKALKAGRLAAEWATVRQTQIVRRRVKVISAKSVDVVQHPAPRYSARHRVAGDPLALINHGLRAGESNP